MVEITEDRVMVDSPMITSWVGNMQFKKQVLVFHPTRNISLMIKSCKKEMGVLEHSLLLMSGEEFSNCFLKKSGGKC